MLHGVAATYASVSPAKLRYSVTVTSPVARSATGALLVVAVTAAVEGVVAAVSVLVVVAFVVVSVEAAGDEAVVVVLLVAGVVVLVVAAGFAGAGFSHGLYTFFTPTFFCTGLLYCASSEPRSTGFLGAVVAAGVVDAEVVVAAVDVLAVVSVVLADVAVEVVAEPFSVFVLHVHGEPLHVLQSALSVRVVLLSPFTAAVSCGPLLTSAPLCCGCCVLCLPFTVDAFVLV